MRRPSAQQPVCRLRPPHWTPHLTSTFSYELKRIDEFTFRFNRRRASHRGLVFYRLLQLAVGAPPVTYRELVVNSKPKGVRPAGVLGPRGRPGTLALPPADKPWRQTQSLD